MAQRRWWMLGAALVAAFAGVLPTAAAVHVDVLSAPKDAAPGDVLTHVFAVTHDDASPATFSLVVGAPEGWEILGVPSQITVPSGEQGVVFVTLTIPRDAPAGLAVTTLRATSVLDPTDDASAGIATHVTIVNRLELGPPEGGRLARGESASYTVRVTNRGNAQDVVAITAASSRGYSVEISSSPVELAPQEARDVLVSLSIPPDAGPGRDVLTVRASSTLYAGVEDEVAIFTTILPPGPDEVGGRLYEVLPAQVTLGIERNETTRAFDSHASISLAGSVFDGTFSASAAALHLFGPDPVEVTAYSLAYRLDRASFAIGTVSQSLTDLHSIACDGGSLTLDANFVRTALVAGGAEGETRFGGRLSAGPEEAQIGFAFSDRRDAMARHAAWSGLAQVEPLDGWTLRVEAGRGTSDGKTGRAALVGTTIDTEPYFLSARAFSVGTYYPGPLQDEAGVEASQRLRLEDLSFALSLAHVWTNVVRDPLAPTLVTDSLGLNVSTAPWADGPTIQGTLTFERKHPSDGIPRDDVAALLGYNVSDVRGPFPYAFSGKIADRIDAVLGTRERTMTHTQDVGLAIDELSLSLRLTEEETVDLVHGVLLASGGSASLIVRPGGTPHEASIEFRSSAGDRLDLEATFVLHPIDDLGISLGGFAEWERGDPAAAEFGWRVEVDASLGVPLPFLVTKGRITGYVFVDQNANGMFDVGETPASDVVVFLGEGEVSTDAHGTYRFLPLAPGSYLLDVRELPPAAVSLGPISVRVIPGDEVRVDIALAPVLRIRGAVFEDANQDGLKQRDEFGFKGVRVVFTDAVGGAVSTTSDAQGDFVLSNARPGTCVVSLDPQTLPERFSYTTPESQSVDAAAPAPVLFGGVIRPRPVVVTFQPPTADATYSPASPRAGEPVTFDASASFDFDGTVVGYAWDFDADGTTDSTDPVASHTFALPGRYRVTLTVTDNAGNADTKTIDVSVGVSSAAGAPAAATAAEAPVTVSPPAVQTPTTTSTSPTTPPSSAGRPPVADFAYEPVAPAAGSPVAFDAAGSVDFDGGIAGYRWDFNGDGVPDALGASAEWTFNVAGSFDVALTVTDATGLTDVAVYTVDVAQAPATPSSEAVQASFVYVPSTPRVGSSVQFDASASADPRGAPLAYGWDFDADGNPDATGAIAQWTFSEPGAHSVTLTVSTPDGRTATFALAVSVLASQSETSGVQPPVAVLEYAPTEPRVGDLVLLSSTESVDFDGRIAAVAWDFTSDGLIDSTDAVTSTTFAAPGDFVVTLTVYDDDGNTDTVSATLSVK